MHFSFLNEKLTNAGQLFPGQHIHNPTSANTGLHDNPAGVIFDHFSYDGGILAKGILPYGGQNRFGVRSRNKSQQLALIGQIERIKP
jgi:hypothetical protein